MIWKKPHILRIYEALTAIADDRIEMNGNKATFFSLSNEKFYNIEYDPINGSIMSNDNVAYYTFSLSSPIIAYLMLIEKIPYEQKLLEIIKDICWDDLNKQFKNDYDKSIKIVLGELKSEGTDVEFVRDEIQKIYDFVCNLQIKTFGKLQRPIK